MGVRSGMEQMLVLFPVAGKGRKRSGLPVFNFFGGCYIIFFNGCGESFPGAREMNSRVNASYLRRVLIRHEIFHATDDKLCLQISVTRVFLGSYESYEFELRACVTMF